MIHKPVSEVSAPISVPLPSIDAARNAVITKAQHLVGEAKKHFPGWLPPPFRPEIFAQMLGIPIVMAQDLGDWDALLVPYPDQTRILCNSSVGSRRRRAFSIAHELTHTFFSDAEDRYHARSRDRDHYEGSEEDRQVERLCDLGAAELLMPRPWFDDTLAAHGFRASTVPTLGETFHVSLEAAACRMVESQQGPAAIGFFHFAPPPSLARKGGSIPPERMAYRARRLFRSRGFPFLFPEGKSVADRSVIYRASMQVGECVDVESFSLGAKSARLHVTAYPLHRQQRVEEPPTVVAAFVPG